MQVQNILPKRTMPTLCALALGLAAAPSFSQTPPPAAQPAPDAAIQEQLQTCVNNAEANMEFAQCYGTAAQALQTRVKQTSAALTAKMPSAAAKRAFAKEEKAFAAYASTVCSFYYKDGFGSMHRSVMGPRCSANIWSERLRLLSSYYVGEE